MKSDDLLLQIARCPEVKEALEDFGHPCRTICRAQKRGVPFHCPEPWSGDIEHAKIMVVSSNPSYDPYEVFPNATWEDERIINFFKNREFTRKVMFWRVMLTFCGHILNTYNDYEITKQIVSTEVVHCKSHKEEGVAECHALCEKKWMSKVMELFNGDIILVSGSSARRLMQKMYPNGINGKYVIYMQHFSRTTMKYDEVYARLDEALKETNRGKSIDIYSKY